MKKGLIAAGILILVMSLGTLSTYDQLVSLDQAAVEPQDVGRKA